MVTSNKESNMRSIGDLTVGSDNPRSSQVGLVANYDHRFFLSKIFPPQIVENVLSCFEGLSVDNRIDNYACVRLVR